MNILTCEHKTVYNFTGMNFKIISLAIGLAVASILFYIVGDVLNSASFIYGAATLSTALYEIAIRAAIFFGVTKCSDNFDVENKWLRKKKFEPKLYRLLKLHAIKGLLPAYRSYSAVDDSAVRTTCIIEISNAVIIPLSYLPLLYAVLARSDLVFIVLMAAFGVTTGLYDLIMLLCQRYNRFRLLDLMARRRQRSR